MALTQQKRERIALVAFLLIVICAVAGSIWYMNVGKQWNTAATRIDDATGSLENYSVLLFDGVARPSSFEASQDRPPRTLSSVVNEYKEKRANVTQLDLVNPARYREGIILKSGQRRIGVLSVLTRGDATRYHNITAQFRREHVDFVVCIAPNESLIQGSRGVEGVDIFIATERDGLDFKGGLKDTFEVESPSVGKIGAIFVSPEGIVSNKTFSGN